MIVQHMQKKEKMLKIAEAAIENKTILNQNEIATTETNLYKWLAEVFDYAYGLGEASGLMIAQNMIKSTDTQINNILKKDPQ